MSFLQSQKKTQASQATIYTGLDIQTSAYGSAVPIVYGTQRVAPNLIWYGDFEATSHKSSAGGKGGGSQGSTSYTYETGLQFALCEGPIENLGTWWQDKNSYPDGVDAWNWATPGSYSQTAQPWLVSGHPSEALNYRGIAYVGTDTYYLGDSADLPNNALEVFGFYSTSVYGSPDADASLVIPDLLSNPHYGAGFPAARVGELQQADETHTVATSITVTNASGFYQNLAVQDSAGNLFTCVPSSALQGQYAYSAGVYTFNSADAGKSVTISYSWVSSLSTYQDYVLAAGLLISVTYSSQSDTATLLSNLAQATNSDVVWSSGILSLVSYGDTALSGNGKTYTPPSQPLFDLTDDDFMPNTNATGSASASSNSDPVLATRTRASDQYNAIKLEYYDRSDAYNASIVESKDQSSIDLYGLREDTSRDGHMFAVGSIALQSAQLQLQRMMTRNTYQFTLDQRFIVLDPMDIVTITDAALGLDRQWVRITEITENDDYSLTFTAEEYIAGNGAAAEYSFGQGSGFSPNYNAAPGSPNAPVFLDAPVQIATTSGLEVWMAVSGGVNWGGCDVYISTDGDNYKYAGRMDSTSRQGVLLSSLPVGSDPDTTNTLSVDLRESDGELLSGTQNDADLGHTLCYVDGELIAYETATLTAANEYALTYLRRGMYGTTIASHATGTQFARMDSSVFVYSYDKSQIGQSIFVKLLGFNVYGNAEQSLADVSPYTHVIQGPPIPPNVTGFNGQQNGGAVVFKWDEVIDYALKGYDILYGPQSGTLANATFLTEAARGTEMTNASVPPGTWAFYIQARDIADQVSATAATFNLTVINENQPIATTEQDPDWLGTLSNFYKHWTGILIPLGTKTCDQYSVLSAPSAPTLNTVSGGSLSATTLYVKTTYVTASGETTASSQSSIAVPAGSLLSVTSPAASGDATAWNIYVGASSGSETLQNTTPVQIGAGWTEPITGLASGASPPSMNTTGWEVFNVFVPDPVSTATYTATTLDTGLVAQDRLWGNITAQMWPLEMGTPDVQFQVDYWSSGSDPGTYQNWSIGYVTARYFNGRIVTAITPGEVPFITGFSVTVDTTPTTLTVNDFSVSSAGTPLTFSQEFHSPPTVQVIPTSSGVTSGVATSVTETDCVVTLYNGTTAVSGTANITISGV